MSAGKKTGNILVWIILLLLIVGLGGFGVSNFGGSVQSIGKVGDTPIPIDDYARELQRELRTAETQTGAPVSVAQAEAFGLVARARGRAVTSATLDNEVSRLGLSVGDAQVRDQVLGYAAFQGLDGTFDREAYRFTLQQNGLTEAAFEEQIRRETARSLLQAAVLGGNTLPETYGKVLLDFIGARRSYTMIELTPQDLDAPVGTPDEAALQTYYDANAEAFTAPETKALTYAWLTPDMLIDSIAPDEDALRALYQTRIDEFMQPERRLVERLIYPTEEEAQAAKARLDSGEVDFETLVAERGLELSDIDLGDVTRAALGPAGDAVFALEAPGVVGPVDTDLGPALIRMNAIIAAQETRFEDARDDLESELALDRARRIISDSITDIDDRLAAGATLEELADETEMTLGRIDYAGGQDDEAIAGYDAFRAAADAVQSGDFPEVIQLEDGGIFALRLDEITPARLRPLNEVRAAAIEGWQQGETRRLLVEKAEGLKTLLDAGDAPESFGLTVETADAVTRGGVTPQDLSETVFALEKGQSQVVESAGGVYLLRLDDILPPAEDDATDRLLLSALETQAAQGIGEDMFIYFSQSLLDAAGLTLDQAAINAVHAQFP
jgi:peptidyl-prolyl cis-trans isomerase D